MYYLGEQGGADNDSLKALDLLFREEDSEKRTRMLQQLNIDMRIIREREKEMYSYSESLYEAGREDGRDEGRVESMRIYMGAGHSFDEAFDLFSVPGMDREEVRSKIDRS